MTVAATELPTLDEVATAIAQAAELDPIERAMALRRLVHSVPAHLAAHADEAVYDATREMTQPAAADRLGVSRSQVEGAVTRHRRRCNLR